MQENYVKITRANENKIIKKTMYYSEKEYRLQNYITNSYETLKFFSEQTDLPYSTIRTVIKRGVENSSIKTMKRISKALNMTLVELLNLLNSSDVDTLTAEEREGQKNITHKIVSII